MTWISSTVLICMHIFIYVTSHVYIRCLDIWMFQRKWWVTHTPGISLYMVPLNSCVFEDQPLTATRPSSQGWGRTGGEPSHSCWSWQFLLLVISVLFIPFHELTSQIWSPKGSLMTWPTVSFQPKQSNTICVNLKNTLEN
jgi:hypothetical protein